MPPQLRELDLHIEQVELAIRDLINEKLNGDTDAIPQHVQQKVIDRIKSALKKNPAMDSERYDELLGQLEFFDLRELQAVIVAKQVWPTFSELFGSKPALEKKLDQLAELRNGIRHSRDVSSIVRKEGEASIEWFQTIVGKAAAV